MYIFLTCHKLRDILTLNLLSTFWLLPHILAFLLFSFYFIQNQPFRQKRGTEPFQILDCGSRISDWGLRRGTRLRAQGSGKIVEVAANLRQAQVVESRSHRIAYGLPFTAYRLPKQKSGAEAPLFCFITYSLCRFCWQLRSAVSTTCGFDGYRR